jgi:thioredoxin-like negative regulator of GroEL
MISLLLAVVLVGVTSDKELVGVTSENAMEQNYAQAYEQSIKQQKPLMVVVGAPWCPACNVLKDSTLRPMAQTGELDAVSLVVVNRDEDPELANQLTKGEQMIPQIILYTPDNGQWKRQKLLGFQSKQPIRSLIRRALSRG